AAPVCGALAAWNFLKVIANIRKGQKVLIHGASGSIGSAAVQIAGILGAEVTGVCSSSDEDFTKNGLTYDVILELTGRLSFSQCRNSLNRNGFFLTTYPTISTIFQMLWTSMFNGKKVIFSATGLKPVSERLEFLEELIKLFKKGTLKTIIDQRFPLEKMVEAHRYVEQGHIKGNVVVNVTHDN
ncbi:MAG TPA: NAD(P)-dependent alcohol dehydrogenase, partial [bacterium]|nr:NAD(P)-dependent alcohol dehydrogenase [bacterium]